ncbi:sensor histidine kinase [Sphaerimonospora sp. CA-214678]|uniref:sensor histidine kinase n=1 Tax=Sphaerimonospora sp. CA-214678 TaxID=3240029 RepID=UPI003D8E731F
MSKEVRLREGEGFSQNLEDYLSDWTDRSGITVEVWALPGRTVAVDLARVVYDTLVEALANVERHSGATHVSIAVTVGAGGLRMTVSDDGAGFAVDQAVRYGGRGLAVMRARFSEVGGRLTINSVPGGGTTVTGVIPVRGE